ncbi:hypothetical protein FA15DRAFT_711252 [Coprinopsis marcescibilis]|uniref:Uncharacterized protein n=1 Tax=Coprinopsis marcescibilis TaxID=230819 RepID=A0A5C3KAR5_COPMA|nr:hypothetical protein FA15DRAFT_711252 [Coprinopsis marcescibilis]
MASRSVSIFHDDSAPGFNFTTGTSVDWVVEQDSKWAGGRSMVFRPDGSSGEVTGDFAFTFEGTSVSFTGSLPIGNDSRHVVVQVDDGTPSAHRFRAGPYQELYRTPNLSAGNHTIYARNLPVGSAIDFAVVIPSQEDNILGKTVIVDNLSNDVVSYEGTWGQFAPKKVSASEGQQTGLPYLDTMHQTSTNGDIAVINFFGSSVSLFGQVSISRPLTVNFTLDCTISETAVFSPESYNNISEKRLNFPLYARQGLSDGLHDLRITLIESNDEVLSLDYILYTASFADPRRATPQKSFCSPPPYMVPAGAIIGGALGGMAVFFFSLFCVVFFVKRRGRKMVRPNSTLLLSLDAAPSISRGVEAFGMAPIAKPPPARSVPQNVHPTPFESSPSEWNTSTPVPQTSIVKDQGKQQLQDSQITARRTTQEFGELYRAVQMLSQETQRLRGQLGERSEDAQPPPYEDHFLPTSSSPVAPPISGPRPSKHF